MVKRTLTDVVIIGAGAAGLMCAIAAGRRGRKVVLLDHNDRAGKKILASGGGRCNFTNRSVDASRYLSSNPRFATSALARFAPADIIALLDQHGIPFQEEDGKLFCARSSKDIVRMFLDECRAAGVKIALGRSVRSIERTDRFLVETSRGKWEADRLVVAAGGLSHSDLGASDLGLRIARQFDLGVVPAHAALVPFIWKTPDRKRFTSLSGISFEAIVHSGERSFRGGVLFTHRGISGPAILQASSHWGPGLAIAIDLMPGEDPLAFLAQMAKGRPKAELKTVLSQRIPKRFAEAWCSLIAPSRPLQYYSSKELRSIAARLHRWEIHPASTEGYGTAEVTAGGVDTGEFSSKTMESKRAPGLFFIGEVVDVTGELGGFNLHWAWASGWVAGQAV